MSDRALDLQTLKTDLKRLIISVANLQDVQAESIDDSKPLFRDGLGLDSIDMLEIAVHLEKKYGLKVQNDEQGRFAFGCINNLAQAVSTHLLAAGNVAATAANVAAQGTVAGRTER